MRFGDVLDQVAWFSVGGAYASDLSNHNRRCCQARLIRLE